MLYINVRFVQSQRYSWPSHWFLYFSFIYPLKQEWRHSKPEQPCRSHRWVCLSANSGSLKVLNLLAHFGDFPLKRLFDCRKPDSRSCLMQAVKYRETFFWDGLKKKDIFSVETLVLRHRPVIASLTVSRLHVSHASQVLCGFGADLLIYRFEVRFPLNAEVLSLVNGVPTQSVFHYHPPIVLLCLKYYWLGARRYIDQQWKWHRGLSERTYTKRKHFHWCNNGNGTGSFLKELILRKNTSTDAR